MLAPGETERIRSRELICEQCKKSVALTQENRDMLGGFAFICPGCRAIVAVAYKGQRFLPATVLSVSWNQALRESASRIEKGLYFAECADQKSLLSLHLMQLYAKREKLPHG